MNVESAEPRIPNPALRPVADQAVVHPRKVHTPEGGLARGLASARQLPSTMVETPAVVATANHPEAVCESQVSPQDLPESLMQDPTVITETTPTIEAIEVETIAEAVAVVDAGTESVDLEPKIPSVVKAEGKPAPVKVAPVAAAPVAPPVGNSQTEVAEVANAAEMIDEAAGADPTDHQSGFWALGLPKEICHKLDQLGYQQPTPIQQETIPFLLEGRDVLGQAQTGTGKTAAFALPLLARIDTTKRLPQVLVLCPTRELAMQVARSIETYAAGIRGFRVAAVYGGQSYQPQIQAIRSGAQVVVGTPGRIMDHMKQGILRIDQLECLVLDEADEMLRMGFIEDVQYVLSHTPDTRQIALFSATMPPAIRQIAEDYLKNPEVIAIRSRQTTAETISQSYMVVPHFQKFETLCRLLEAEDSDGVIVFTKTKVTTVEVAEALNRRGYSAAALNGDIAQSMRERAVQHLKDRKLDILVATDVAARGLDIQRVSHVINYDLPHDTEAYVHRIGRTGRAGREGVAILLVTPKETRFLKDLHRQSGNRLTETELPSVEQLNQKRIEKFQQKVTQGLEHPGVEFFARMLQQLADQSQVEPIQLAAALAALYQGEQPLLLEELKGRQRKATKGLDVTANQGYDTYRVAVGRRDRVQAKHLVGAIANESGLSGDQIGRIRILDNCSLVDLPAGMQDHFLSVLGQTRVGGKPMNLELDPHGADNRQRPQRGGYRGEGQRDGNRGDGYRSEGNRGDGRNNRRDHRRGEGRAEGRPEGRNENRGERRYDSRPEGGGDGRVKASRKSRGNDAAPRGNWGKPQGAKFAGKGAGRAKPGKGPKKPGRGKNS